MNGDSTRVLRGAVDCGVSAFRTGNNGSTRTSSMNGMSLTLVEPSEYDPPPEQSLPSASAYLARLWDPLG